MSRRTKILLRLTAFLSLVRWTHILFLAVAQGLAAFTLLRNGAPIQWATLAGVILSTAGIVAGGSLFNSFYDLERDLIERPWRTLLERPVAKKYGMKLAFSFYGICRPRCVRNVEMDGSRVHPCIRPDLFFFILINAGDLAWVAHWLLASLHLPLCSWSPQHSCPIR